MRRPRKEIQPRIRINRKLAPPIEIRIGQRSNARPEFRGTVGIENLRERLRPARFTKQAVPLSSDRVQLIAIRKWEKVHGPEDAENRVSSLSRHCIAMIEAAPSRAGARNEHCVKGLPPSLVRRES